MRVVIQRVSSSSVTINGEVISKIGKGFNILLGIKDSDTESNIDFLVSKISKLRVFEDESGKMNLGLGEIDGQVLIISQFTLYADTKKGNRPSFVNAGKPDFAEKMYELFIQKFENAIGREKVKTGKFGADMKVDIQNDGPVTIIMDTDY